jgi:hypothetical protein
VGIVTAAAFGPYILGGIRTEQLAIYSSLIAAVLLGLLLRCPSPALPLQGIWLAIVAVVAIVGQWPPLNTTSYPTGSLSAGMDNFFAPMALLILVPIWSQMAPARLLLRVVGKIVVCAMSINAAIAIVCFLRSDTDWLHFLPRFWSAQGATQSVAARAITNLRYTGVFNQPSEAGIAYGLSIFLLLYLLADSARFRPVLLSLTGALLVVGGLLTGSKVFLVGGVPVGLLIHLRTQRGRGRSVATGIVAIGTYIAVSGIGWLPSFASLYISKSLSSADSGRIHTLTAGRLGTAGSLLPVARSVLRASPLYGLGGAGLTAPYDSAWLEVLVVGGLVGVMLLAAFYVALFVRWFRVRHALAPEVARLGAATLLMATVASIGVPAFTANRSGTLLLIVLGLTLVPAHAPASERGTDPPIQPDIRLVPAHASPICGSQTHRRNPSVPGRSSQRINQ